MSAKCPVCTKTVYALEAQTYDGQDYHKSCFKCLKCNSVMGISSVAKIKGDLFCRPCFKKIFTEKGSYASFGAKTLAKNAPVKDLIASGQIDGCGSPVACETPTSPTPASPVVVEKAPEVVVAVKTPEPVVEKVVEPVVEKVVEPVVEKTAEPEVVEAVVEKASIEDIVAEVVAEVEAETVEVEVGVNPGSPVVEELVVEDIPTPLSTSSVTSPSVSSPTAYEAFQTPRATTAASVDFNRSRFNTVAPKCEICTKSVYPMEIQTYDDSTYHKNCFKCLQCTKIMTQLGSVAKIKGDLYCKPCFKKIFTERGSYASFGAKTLAKNAPVKDLIASGCNQ